MRLHTRRVYRRRCGFTLIELLVAVLLLSLSLAAMVTLWSVSRKITERSRDSAEYYAIARQEAERFRVVGFQSVFNEGRSSSAAPYTYYNPVTPATVWPPQYYDEKGTLLGSSTGASYRAVSSFGITTAGGSGLQQLGYQTISVYTVADATTVVYSTNLLFGAGGI